MANISAKLFLIVILQLEMMADIESYRRYILVETSGNKVFMFKYALGEHRFYSLISYGSGTLCKYKDYE